MSAAPRINSGRIGYALICLFAFMAVGLMLSVFTGQLVTRFCHVEESTSLMLLSVIQNIFSFILPTILVHKMYSENGIRFLQLNGKIQGIFFIEIVILMLFMMPAMDWVVNWNSSLSMPKSWHNIEVWMRQQEDLAQTATNKLLGFSGVGGLLLMIVAIGIITGVGEECFFRGGLQRILQNRINPHLAIWIAAVTFSAIHFQFFGFIPRMLLGAFFGYLYFWTKSLWTPIFGHALNNSIVVCQTWASNGQDMSGSQVYGTDCKWVVLSLVLTLCGLYVFWKHTRNLRMQQE